MWNVRMLSKATSLKQLTVAVPLLHITERLDRDNTGTKDRQEIFKGETKVAKERQEID